MPLVCNDNFYMYYMCNPMPTQATGGGGGMSGTSWALMVVLVLITMASVSVFASAAKGGWTRSSWLTGSDQRLEFIGCCT